MSDCLLARAAKSIESDRKVSDVRSSSKSSSYSTVSWWLMVITEWLVKISWVTNEKLLWSAGSGISVTCIHTRWI